MFIGVYFGREPPQTVPLYNLINMLTDFTFLPEIEIVSIPYKLKS